MPAPKNVIEKALRDGFPTAEITVVATVMDNDHYNVLVKSIDFKGLTMMQQHRLVIKALGNLANEVHSISIKTSVPYC